MKKKKKWTNERTTTKKWIQYTLHVFFFTNSKIKSQFNLEFDRSRKYPIFVWSANQCSKSNTSKSYKTINFEFWHSSMCAKFPSECFSDFIRWESDLLAFFKCIDDSYSHFTNENVTTKKMSIEIKEENRQINFSEELKFL